MERVSLALESYLEAISDIQAEQGAVSPSVLAEKMGCKRSSVTSALQRLAENGLINYHTYRPVTLSQKGKEVIESLNKYHNILSNFFQNILGFDEEFSQKEACKLEHQIDPEIIERIKEFSEFLKEPEAFKNYLASKDSNK